ncbi:MAG: DNA-processing protein DprA [Candidatus Margulisiibacteriota bacterium]
MAEQLKYWLAINKIPEVGPVTVKKLFDQFGVIEKAWQAEEKEILSIEGINQRAAKSFLEYRTKIDLEQESASIAKAGVEVLTLLDDNYPSHLKNIYDPPPVLYYKGQILKEDEKAIAIVGTRKASHYGLETAKKLARELAGMGITIVSGLASGIDTAAHEGALEAGGRTLAVFGTGVDVIFPAENRVLAQNIAKSGALLSEFALGTRGERSSFPRRNRIISGLSLGVIVVEGHYDSGAMITAKFALDQGREAFAVPGNVELEQSKGPHWLIKQGAKLVECVEDVIEELKFQITSTKSQTIPNNKIPNSKPDYSDLSEEERRIVGVLSREPKHLDVIAAETGFPIPQISSMMLMLEMKKAVRQLPGKMYTGLPHS